MTATQTSKRSSLQLRPFAASDLTATAALHLVAFPDSALTALGAESVRRYYDWQLNGPHDAIALSVDCDGELAGFCFAGVFRGAMGGFLQKNRNHLAWRVATHPWLIASPLFRERLIGGVQVLRRVLRPPVKPAPKRNEAPLFGILAIAVHPKFQGLGVGKLLMQEAEAVARARGFAAMQLSVNTENHQAIRFYEGLGWQKTLKENLWKGEMRKSLTT